MTEPRTLADCLLWLLRHEGQIDFRRTTSRMPFLTEHHDGMRIEARFKNVEGDERQVMSSPTWFRERLYDHEGMLTAVMCKTVYEMKQLMEKELRGQEEEKQVSACLCDEFPCIHDSKG